MDFCSNTNPVQSPDVISQPPYAAAGHLARLLKASPEYQHYLDLSRKIYSDPQVSPLIRRLQMMQSAYFRSDDGQAANQILAELNALPVMQEYAAAEQQVRLLFHAVEDLISQGAGLPFAENAVASGFG